MQEIKFTGEPVLSEKEEDKIREFLTEYLDDHFLSRFSQFFRKGKETRNPIEELTQLFFKEEENRKPQIVEGFIKIGTQMIEEKSLRKITDVMDIHALQEKLTRTGVQQYIYDMRWLFLNTATEEIENKYNIIIQNAKKAGREEHEITKFISEQFAEKIKELQAAELEKQRSAQDRFTYM